MLNLAVKFVKSIVNTSSSALDTLENSITKGGKTTDKWLDKKLQEVELDLVKFETNKQDILEKEVLEQKLEVHKELDKIVQQMNQIKSPVIREKLAKDPMLTKYVSTSVDSNGNTVYKFK